MSEMLSESSDAGILREPFPDAFRRAISDVIHGADDIRPETVENVSLILRSLGHTLDKPSDKVGGGGNI